MRSSSPGGRSSIFAPIRGRNRNGFIIGWLAIVVVGALGFGFATVSLSYSSVELALAEHGGMPPQGPAS